MAQFFILVTVFVLFAIPPSHAQLVSCEDQGSWAGKIVCSDTELSVQERMTRQYIDEISSFMSPADRGEALVSQAEWENSLSSCRTISEEDGVTPKECLMDMYRARNESLQIRLATLKSQNPQASMAERSLEQREVVVVEGNAFTEQPQQAAQRKPDVPRVHKGAIIRQENDASDKRDAKKGRNMPSRISVPSEISSLRECEQEAGIFDSVSSCLRKKVEDAEVNLQIVASRLEMTLRERDLIKRHGLVEDNFQEARKAFRRHREMHCEWLRSLHSEDDEAETAYKSCYADQTRARTAFLERTLEEFGSM